MAFVDFVYRQLSGFAKAGTRLQPAATRADLIFSRIIAAMLIVAAIGAIVLTQFYAHINARLIMLLLVIEIPLMGYIYSFSRGVSIKWLAAGLLHYWLALLLLLLLFAALGWLFITVFFGTPNDKTIIFVSGITISVMAFFMGLAFIGRGRAKHGKFNKALSWFSVLLWLGFLAAGIIAVAVAFGL